MGQMESRARGSGPLRPTSGHVRRGSPAPFVADSEEPWLGRVSARRWNRD